MPFTSHAQQRWGNSPAGVKALGGPSKVAEWNAATAGKKLPERKTRRQAIKEAMREVYARARSKEGGQR
jgi:hypothetical protein